MQHRLSDIDPDHLLATCAIDGPVIIRRSGDRYRCDVAVRAKIKAQEEKRKTDSRRDRSLRYPARRVMAERLQEGKCERCGFEAEDLCQLDVDHIVRRTDGGSDRPENLVVLCANCHRVKSRLERVFGLLEFDYGRFMALSV